MDVEEKKAILEAMLFASGRAVKITELMSILEQSKKQIEEIIQEMMLEYNNKKRGIEIIKIDDTYQMCTKKEYFDYIHELLDNRSKPNLSKAALETLSIIAYNSRITKAEIESVRGVNSDGSLYKLLEYGLIEEAGKSDAPGKPMTYKTANEFLKVFGYSTLNDLPELPKIDKININENLA